MMTKHPLPNAYFCATCQQHLTRVAAARMSYTCGDTVLQAARTVRMPVHQCQGVALDSHKSEIEPDVSGDASGDRVGQEAQKLETLLPRELPIETLAMPLDVSESRLSIPHRAVRVITPRNNQLDVLACETFLAALVADAPGQIALELCGTNLERLFIVRGDEVAVTTALQQLAHAYPQCDFEDLSPDQDPIQNDAMLASPVRQAVELRLRDAVYLPLRTAVSREGRSTYDDYSRAADPMIGLISAMDGLRATESCVIQFALLPMPDDWSRFWRGTLDDVNVRTRAAPQSMATSVLTGLGLMGCLWGVIAIAFAITLKLSVWIWLLGILLGLAGVGFLYLRFKLPSPPDPDLVRKKIHQSAFRVCARIFVFGDDLQLATYRMDRIKGAFRGYNLAGGNGFVFVPALNDDPSQLVFEKKTFWSRLPVIYNLSPSRLRPVLNLTEMASLWHLPHAAAGIQGIAYTSSKRIMPLQNEVNAGVLVGESRGQGRSVLVSLSVNALRGNIGMVAKTQSGKSNLMAILANDVIQNDPDATVILIDPHRSLAQKVASLVPPERESQTIYWSLADRERPFGLNLIDRMPKSGTGTLRAIAGASAMFVDKRVSDVIDAFNEIWPNNWGPRMEDYIRGPLLTMAAANDVLVEGLAFEDWHIAAHAAFVANKDQIVRGTLDEDGRQMIEGTCQTFRALKPPSRPSRHKIYKLLGKGFDLFERMLVVLPTARPSDTTAYINAVRQLYTLLCVEHAPERRPERGAGLSARLYETEDGKRKPLQYTLLDVNPILANSQMRLTALGGLNDEEHRHIKDWWKDSFDNYLNLNPKLLLDMVTPVRTKMNRFRASDIARRIFGQPESTIDLPKLVQQGGLLIVDLASGVIGQETAALIGSSILNWIASIIFAQQESATASAATGKPRRIVLIVDEFQSIPGADYAFMLSELGKYGVQLCLGTQSLELLDQLNTKTRRAWLNNTSSLFVFRSGGDDARELARELSIADEDQLTISPSDIVGLPEYSCFARVRGVSTPFRIDTRKASDGSEATLERIREASRAKYGRDAKLVDYWLRLASDLQGQSDLTEQSGGGGYGGKLPSVPVFAIQGRAAEQETDSDGVGDFAVVVEAESDLASDVEDV